MADSEVPTEISLEDASPDTNVVTPPVLDVSSSTSTAEGATAAGNDEATDEKETSVRKPVAETIPGLNSMMSEWQVSSLPEYRQFFSTEDESMFVAAVSAIKARLDENDSNIRKAWLLTEIDHWDLEKERIVVLTDNNLISVKYNFIQQLVDELKFIPLAYIREIHVGDFKYTYSYGYARKGKGLKIVWGQEPISFWTKWNPVSSSVPYVTFASHILVTNKKIEDPKLTLETAIDPIESAILEFREKAKTTESPPPSLPEFKKIEGDIVIDYYLGLSAMIHNQSYLGFFKKRGAINW